MCLKSQSYSSHASGMQSERAIQPVVPVSYILHHAATPHYETAPAMRYTQLQEVDGHNNSPVPYHRLSCEENPAVPRFQSPQQQLVCAAGEPAQSDSIEYPVLSFVQCPRKKIRSSLMASTSKLFNKPREENPEPKSSREQRKPS